MLKHIVKSMRPKQWVKNLLVFAALIFSENLLAWDKLVRTAAAFIFFCLVSGAVYVINDVVDRENDRTHPKKRLRPIAAGELPVLPALVAAVLAVGAGIGGGFYLNWRFGLVIAIYFLLQLGYSFVLKKIVVLDVMVVAAGFALRAISGTYVIAVQISPWLFVCTILLALFLALAKRRHELLFLEGGGISHRSVLGKYSETLLDQMIAVATSATVITYCLYTIAPETVHKFGTHNLILTMPFVLYGIYRYLYLVYRREEGGAPEKVLFTDLPLIIDVFLWMISVVLILYF
ncbi:MAG: decaprenyl-phosphate phosphoribosyltransferase [candidate division WOR-3 bacterium]|uniref:Decaprenyl-phosphate phosphoribosyltransferase n=1 Tax=candidate division WOR-3 bacterium TaxID=2052148 RepID=A0A7C1WHX6_UNCW3|nr:decaprenyl-phosphate phosphoribosyltransferase [candidate division WOR-3 bacterium]